MRLSLPSRRYTESKLILLESLWFVVLEEFLLLSSFLFCIFWYILVPRVASEINVNPIRTPHDRVRLDIRGVHQVPLGERSQLLS